MAFGIPRASTKQVSSIRSRVFCPPIVARPRLPAMAMPNATPSGPKVDLPVARGSWLCAYLHELDVAKPPLQMKWDPSHSGTSWLLRPCQSVHGLAQCIYDRGCTHRTRSDTFGNVGKDNVRMPQRIRR